MQAMSTERVLSALNFLIGEGVNHYPEGCDASTIEVLITDYFNEGLSNDESDDESDHRNDGINLGNSHVKFKDIVRRSAKTNSMQ